MESSAAVVRAPGPVNGIPYEKVPAAMVPDGMPFPTSLDGAISAGNGKVRITPEGDAAAVRRAVRALTEANAAGLPMADAAGDLPAGIHAATRGEFLTRFGGTPRRQSLLKELQVAFTTLRDQGVDAVVVGGSFVTGKAGPGDVDLAWIPGERTNVPALQRGWAKVAPSVRGISPHNATGVVTNAPILKGATPGETFLEFLQHDRTGARRGAVLLSTADAALDSARTAPGLRHELAEHALRGVRALAAIR